MQFFKKLLEAFQPIFKNRLFIGILMLIFVVAIIVYGVLRALALDESTWRVGDGQATQLITGSGESVVITASAVTLDKDFLWPGLDWNHKRNVEIKNITANILPLDDTITISVNTSALEQVQASCNDLRVGYIVEGKLVEIPRSVVLGSGSTNCNDSKDTKVSFRLQRELTHAGAEGYILGDEYDSNYAIFYGNSGVGDTAPTYLGERSLYFDGIDDRVNLGTSLPITAGANTLYSVSFWVKVDSTFDYGAYKTMIGSLSSGWNAIYFQSPTQFKIQTAGGVGSGNTWNIDAVNDNAWHHFVLIVDSSNSHSELYQNGVNKGVKTNQFYSSRSHEYIGGQTSVGTYFKGSIDDVFYYNSVLTEASILELYNGNLPDVPMYLGYNFDETSGQDIFDISGNNVNKFLGSNNTVESIDPTRVSVPKTFDISNISPTLLCPLGGTTNCLNNVTPSAATGAIRYNSGGSAISFDGFNDYIDTPNITLNELTFSAWVKSNHRGGDSAKIQNLTGGTGIFDYLSIYSGRARVYDGVAWRESSTVIPDGQWGHIVMSFRGSDKQLKLYVNNTLVYSGSNISNYTNGSLTVLGKYTSNLRYFMGSMDYIRLDNTVLSDAEISNLYNGGNPQLVGPSDSTLLLYYLDENGLDSRLSATKTSLQTAFGVTGNYVAYDASGNNNHGLIVGAQYTNDTPLGDSGVMSNEGILIEEGTTNKVLNPSFENAVYDKHWSKGYENANFDTATFVAKMAKRNTAGPFGAGVTVQGNDVLTVPSGNQVSGNFYQNMDHNQGSIAFWITPSWNGTDGLIHDIYKGNGISISKWSDNNIYVRAGSTSVYIGAVPVNTWTAGTTYNVIVSWDTKNTINGTHYVRVSINGVNSYIRTTALPTLTNSDYQIGGNAIIEGLTVYRRVLFDGTHGVDIGNGNEISQIYNSGTGKDPAEITGSWDIVFVLPTDASVGELTSTNQAWSMPHSTNLLGTGGFLMNSNFSTDGFNKYSNNQLLNSSFENNLDNWNYTQEYLLRDEFNDTLPATLASGGVSNPTPTLGSELVVNGGMEPPYISGVANGWYSFQDGSSVFSEETSNVHSGSSAQKITVSGGTFAPRLYQSNVSTVPGNWYEISYALNNLTGSNKILFRDGNSVGTGMVLNYDRFNSQTSWTLFKDTARAISTSTHLEALANTGTSTSYFDTLSVKPLTLSSLFSSVSVPSSTDYTVQSNVTLTSGTQAGVVVSLDSDTNPNNFVIAYHDGTTARLEKNVNGTYTQLISTNVTYVAGAPIKVIKNGNSYTMFYNNAIVGTTQTISDASIINNTRHGVFSTYESNSFTNFEVKGGVNGTLASDGVNSRLIKDSYSKLNISNNSLNFEAGALASTGIHYSAIDRLLGRILYSKFTWDSGQEGRITWDDNTGIGSATHNFGFYNGAISGYGSSPYNPSLGPALQSGVEYEVSIILKDAGAYYFIRGGIYPNWTLLGYAGTFSSGPLYPSVFTTSTTPFVASFETISVPDLPYIPTPLAYDTFTRNNGNVGNTEILGPDGQTTNSLSWDRGEVVDNKLRITPTLGDDVIVNGGFDTDTGWTKDGGWSISGGFANAAVSGTGNITQSVLNTNSWYQSSYDATFISGAYRLFAGGVAEAGLIRLSGGSFVETIRAVGTSAGIRSHNSFNGTIDNITFRPLTLSSLFSTLETNTSDIIMDTNITLTTGTQAGLVMNLDSVSNPQNFVIAYRDGGNIKLEKNVNGVYTTVQTTASTYVAGAQLRVIKDGTKYRVYYNNALVGSEQTITDPSIINNTRHGIFSTYEGNTFDNFTIFPRGTNGEYNDIPADDLTAYRDTSRTYNGVSSVKLISGGNHAPFTQTKTLENSTYEVSTYVYKDGTAVTSSDIEIYYNSNPVSSTYEDAGSGWYRVYGNITGMGTSAEVGVQVKANKSLNIDNLELKISIDQLTIENITANNKVFNSGYTVNSDNGSGIYKDINITTGQDIVIRGIANSDGTSIPKLSVYDVTNDIEIGYLLGTNTSTKSTPDNLIFTAEGTHASKATGTVTLTTNPIDGDLLEIGGVIYEFKDDISNPLASEIYVKIGADSTETSSNLVLAIMGGSGAGTNYSYGTGSVAHTSINATNIDNVLNIESKTTGKINNNITISEVGNSITISNSTLINGRDNSSVLRVRLLNNSNTISTVNWHQVEVYNNLVNNGSFDRGFSSTTGIADSWGAYGTGHIWSKEESIVRSGYSQKISGSTFGGVAGTPVTYQPGIFYYRSLFARSDISQSVGFQSNATGLGGKAINTIPNQWVSLRNVKSNLNAGADAIYLYKNAGNETVVYFDDIITFPLTAVPLTTTPSTLTDSTTNDGGVIVNGSDTLSMPLNMSNPNIGVIRFDYTPTWSNPSVHTSAPMYIFDTDSGSRISLYYSGTTYSLVVNGHTVTNTSLVLNAGQRYSIEVSYNAGGTSYLKVDGNIVASTTGFNGFTTTGPTTLYLGSRYTGESQVDATFHPYTSSTISSNTDMSYVKYGTKSTRIQTTTATDEYVTELNLGNTNNHTLSMYVYDGTSGNIGGTINNTIAQLIFNNNLVTTTYTDQGGGWWRLSYTGAGVDANGKYGLQVKSGKNVYVDGVMVHQRDNVYQTGLSRYFDGGLGTGYAWSGTANESTSVRTAGSLQYINIPINVANNTVSFWMKLETPMSHVSGSTIFTLGGYTVSRNPSGNANNFRFAHTNGSDIRYNPGFNNTDWYFITITDAPGENPVFYINGIPYTVISYQNGVQPPDAIYTSPATLSIGASSTRISDFRIYNNTLTTDQIAQLYNQGMNTYSIGNTSGGKYATEGIWTSQVIDLGNNGQWGMSPALSITDNKGADNIIYKTRTSPDNNNWSEYQSVVSVDGGFDFSSPANRYMQVEATLQSSNQSTTPSFSGMQFNYVMDTIKPATNATEIRYYNQVEAGELQTPNDWTKYDSPYISWTAGADNLDGSGLRGYCLYLGQDINADPENDSGLLSTTSPVHTSDTNCEFIIGTNNIDLSNTAYRGETWMTSSNSPYYLKIKAVDMTGNVYGTTAADAEVYTFKLDNTKPNNPKGISAPQTFQREISSFRVFWADSGTSMATDTHSGVKGYQYRIGENGTWYGAGHTGDQDCNDLVTTSSYNLQEQFVGEEYGDELSIGSNVFYLRTWDNICNVTETYATAILQYSADAPSAPQNLVVDPVENDVNEFTFTWDQPEVFSGNIAGLTYCYTVNALPGATRCNWTPNLTLSSDAYANQPGENILYLVAKDEAGNVNYADYTSVTFSADTSAPGLIRNLEVSDVSIKSTQKWRLALSWDEPEEKGAGIKTYRIYRSSIENSNYALDPESFEHIATIGGESFTDVNLDQKVYYYVARACDSANNCGAPSNTVSLLPTGRFFSPAKILVEPIVSSLSTRSATITWITERESDSKIAFGLAPGEYFEEEVSNSTQLVEHSITLNNLVAGTTYYYMAKWTDEDGNTGMSDDLSFKTAPPPVVKDVELVYINLDSAGIKFTTKGSSKVKIYYGESSTLGQSAEMETSPVETTYTMMLTGLNDGKKYFYKINLFDIEDNEYDGTVLLSFETPPRPLLSNVRVQEKYGTAQPTLEITWESNTEVNSVVRFYPTGREDLAQNRVDIDLVKGEHTMSINGLIPETPYMVRVEGTDRYGNLAMSESIPITTATDTRPPLIYDLQIESTILGRDIQPDRARSAQVIVSWKTDEPATSQVEFDQGLGDAYGQSTSIETNRRVEHVIIIPNLSPSAVYHLRVSTLDVADNESKSEKMVVVTPKATNTVLEVVTESLSNIFNFLW